MDHRNIADGSAMLAFEVGQPENTEICIALFLSINKYWYIETLITMYINRYYEQNITDRVLFVPTKVITWYFWIEHTRLRHYSKLKVQ